jgi:hypothetical protein
MLFRWTEVQLPPAEAGGSHQQGLKSLRGGRSLQTGTVMSRRLRLALGIGQGLVDDLI